MAKKTKILILFILMFSCTFFINVEGVSATESCQCGYQALKRDQVGKEGILQNTYFLIAMKFDTDGQYALSSDGYCELSAKDWGSNGKLSAIKKTCNGKWKSITQGSDLSITADQAKAVANSNCSKEQCNSIGMRLCFGINGKWYTNQKCAALTETHDLKWIDSEKYEKETTSDDGAGVATGSTDKATCDKKCQENIKKWGSSGTSYDNPDDFAKTCDVISQEIKDILNTIFWIISVSGVILLLVMTLLEFIKVITGQDDEGIKKALKHTLIRAVCAVLLLMLPVILTAIINIINQNAESGATIGANGDIFCGVGK